jgi:hypothetical protein
MAQSYKARLYLAGVDRREVADRLGLTYSQLTSRLNGFARWGREERELQRYLAEFEREKESVQP